MGNVEVTAAGRFCSDLPLAETNQESTGIQ